MKGDTLTTILGVMGIALLVGVFSAIVNYSTAFNVDAQGQGTLRLRGRMWLGAVMLVVGGVALLIGTLVLAYNFRGGETLPTVPGTILSITPFEGRTTLQGNTTTYDGLRVEYTYSIDGVDYHVTTEAVDDEDTEGWDVGDTIPVYYYRTSPHTPLLYAIESQVMYLAAGFGISFLLLGALVTFGPYMVHGLMTRVRS